MDDYDGSRGYGSSGDRDPLPMNFTYSPNMMGPASLDWYKNNNIPYAMETFTPWWEGDDAEARERKKYEQYAGGRIDISCETCMWEELGAPIMKAIDWNKLHDFCDEFSSETRLNEIEFFGEFEKWLGRPIQWAPGEYEWLKELRNDV